MNDNQIIKALQICIDDAKKCDGCPAATEHNGCAEVNDIKVIVGILTRQQEKIETLRDVITATRTERTVYKKLLETARVEAIKEFASEFDKVLAEMRDAYFEDDHVAYGLVCETVHARLSMFTKKMVGANNG